MGAIRGDPKKEKETAEEIDIRNPVMLRDAEWFTPEYIAAQNRYGRFGSKAKGLMAWEDRIWGDK